MCDEIHNADMLDCQNIFADALLGKVKSALRRPPNMDDELTDIINACREDLALVGVCCITAHDPLIIRAVILYAKANFSFSADSGMFQQAYDTLKISLSLSGNYKQRR